jgi:hypothetical protein
MMLSLGNDIDAHIVSISTSLWFQIIVTQLEERRTTGRRFHLTISRTKSKILNQMVKMYGNFTINA